jgi:hypothetical protein
MRAVTHLLEMHDGKQLEIASSIPNLRKSDPPYRSLILIARAGGQIPPQVIIA